MEAADSLFAYTNLEKRSIVECNNGSHESLKIR